ncbi:Alpha/Beta hydrolase protein [Dactylonectria macrodidyma]|uniref:Carboxylic ester hydrolase n=1 Tax=Dactylonectria macrodidyma TaxID=307937 RepID=A0A9P9E8G4_9HYPO|nr:Alpha/Beta hydrolase protein [Dactylonectria macrodidyma]
MPASITPTGTTKLSVEGLGEVEGFTFPAGVRQFSGIPYATLTKRWTRSQLNTSWPDKFHNGTKLGCRGPQPPEYDSGTGLDPLVPVGFPAHYKKPAEDELNCLVMNITAPSVDPGVKIPVMVYIHGGSFLYGASDMGVFDGVNFVTHALTRNTPVVAVNLNYRVGLGGFLASKAIKDDLARDGYEGVGNFGLCDQQVALQWVSRYISSFGGDADNVTIYGESAGGMSVSHQIAAKNPAPFHRAIAMSGHLSTIPAWSLEHHEKHYRALLTHVGIDPESPSALEQLRKVPEADVARATLAVEGIFVATGSPCNDGVFHAMPPSFNAIASPPSWLKSYMVGDVYDEGMIFYESFCEDDYSSVHARMAARLGTEVTDEILALYEITPDLPKKEFVRLMEVMSGDTTFKTHNWVAAHRSQVERTFGYHFDQICTHEGLFKGLAYHGLDLLYLFLNFDDNLTPGQRELARSMVNHFIDFAYGKDPWPRISEGKSWMRYGPDDVCKVVTEAEDEEVRRYSRMDKIIGMGVYEDFTLAVDDIAVKRHRMGTFEWKPEAIGH